MNVVLLNNHGQMIVKPMPISYVITGEQFLQAFLDFHSSTRVKTVLQRVLDFLSMRRTIIASIKVTVVLPPLSDAIAKGILTNNISIEG